MTPTQAEAEGIGIKVLEERLAAGIQISGPVQSSYWWRGSVERATEYLLVMKTTRGKYDQLVRVIRSRHSYEIPEIVVISIHDGSDDYLAWISEETRGSGEPA